MLAYRQRLIPLAEGQVLEIGVGSGLNLPLYSSRAESVIALDPSPELLDMARQTAARMGLSVKLLEASAEAIPLDDKSIDTVLTSWTLCTIPDVRRALAEARRVLKPNGRLLFVEHGLAPDASVQKWQNWLTPAWKRIGGGCHLNRPIRALIEGAGFRIERLETGYMNALKTDDIHVRGCGSCRLNGKGGIRNSHHLSDVLRELDLYANHSQSKRRCRRRIHCDE